MKNTSSQVSPNPALAIVRLGCPIASSAAWARLMLVSNRSRYLDDIVQLRIHDLVLDDNALHCL